ncbi:MAG: PilZ domain-containing protein [Nitrospirota bacterium]
MEKRQSNRFNVYFNADIISEKAVFNGFVGNLSENGLYARISAADSRIVFPDFADFCLRLRLPDKEYLNLLCRLIWSSEILLKNTYCESAYNMGFEILSPVPEYSAFHENMLMENFNERLKQYLQ